MLNTIPYLLALAIELIGLPIVLSSAVSLYSKLTAQKTQGVLRVTETELLSNIVHVCKKYFR